MPASGMGRPDERSFSNKFKAVLIDNLFILCMILSLIIGVIVGLTVRQLDNWQYYEKRKIFYLRFPGDLLLNMLKMLILPLVVSSIISAMASLDSRASGRIGLRALVYYLTTTFFAVVLGIVLVLAIQPGYKGGDIDKTPKDPPKQKPLDSLFDLIRNCFPDNLIEAAFRTQYTDITENESFENGTIFRDVLKVKKSERMNILGLVVFSIFFGAVVSRMGKQGKPLLDFFEALHVATMKLTMIVIWYSPIGIMFLVSTKLIEMEDPEKMFIQLAYYMLTVLVGLFIHGFIVLTLIFFIATRTNPFMFMFNMLKAMLTAWGTASSSATLPVTMECLEFRNKIDIRIAKFVAPIGATVNMDGTALYEAVAVIFIAQTIGQSLSVADVIIISLTATAAAIGAAGIPSAGLVTMSIVLTAVGLPLDEISLIISIDWFLDRFRTAINVLGDSFGAGIVAKLSANDLQLFDEENAGDELAVFSNIEEKEKEATKDGEAGMSNGGYTATTGLDERL